MILQLPLNKNELEQLEAGMSVRLSGSVYTARDAAHKRLVEIIENGGKLPFDLDGAAIYYAGPCPARPGRVIGSCGPTSAIRMDAYAPVLFDNGVKVTIAKGPVAEAVRLSIIKNKAVYLCAAGGTGALISHHITAAETVAFPELGTEAVRRLTVEDFPLIVGIDSKGESLFK